MRSLFHQKVAKILLACAAAFSVVATGLIIGPQASFATNAGDIFVSATNTLPTGHETDPHLSCPSQIYLWGNGLTLGSGTFSIDGYHPSGSATGNPFGGAYHPDQAWPNDNANASIPPKGGATWSYTGGGRPIATISTAVLIANAQLNGDLYQPQQGYHFKIQFTQLPQKHKTFWVDCKTPTPQISVVKTANPTSYSGSGDQISYSYLVTNTGNVALTDVTVNDNLLGKVTSCKLTSGDTSNTVGTLYPGDSETCTATTLTTQANLDNGSITNIGTATGTPTTGGSVTATSTAVVNASQTPAISLVKTAIPTTYSGSGETITYSYFVKNTGNVTLTDVTVNDSILGSVTSCKLTPADTSKTAGTLAPGDSETCTATATTNSTNVTQGSITNIGTATGTAPDGSKVTATSTAVVNYVPTPPTGQKPFISLVKTAAPTTYSGIGETITYSYFVKNTGYPPLTDVTVSDNLLGNVTSCKLTPGDASATLGTLQPGDSETCTATALTTQANVDNGSITNIGTATGKSVTDGSVVTAKSTAVVNAIQTPAISLLKTANPTSYSGSGDQIIYSYLVKNTGNVTLKSIQVKDNILGSVTSCNLATGDTSKTPGTLAPGDSETCSATATTSPTNVTQGSITNIGTATGTAPDGSNVTASSTAVVNYQPGPPVIPNPPVLPNPSSPSVSPPVLTIVKSATPASIAAGGSSEYTIGTSITGTVDTPITVTDKLTSYPGVTYSLGHMTTPTGDATWTSCAIASSSLVGYQLLSCSFNPSSSVTNPTFEPIIINVATATNTPTEQLSNVAVVNDGTSSNTSNVATISVTASTTPAVVSASSAPSVPSNSPPATGQPSTVTVPSVHTGKPWASPYWWYLVSGIGIVGMALLIPFRSRKLRVRTKDR